MTIKSPKNEPSMPFVSLAFDRMHTKAIGQRAANIPHNGSSPLATVALYACSIIKQ